MAQTTRTYTGTGSPTVYDVDFDLGYISKDHIFVYRGDDYTAQLSYTYVNDLQIQVDVTGGEEFVVRRVVPRNVAINNFTDGAFLRGLALDTSYAQALMIIEEIQDGYVTPSGDGDIGALSEAAAASAAEAQAAAISASESATAGGSTLLVMNYQSLRDYTGSETTFYTRGKFSGNDGGGSFFQKYTGAAPAFFADNAYNIIVPTGGDGSEAWLCSTKPFPDVANAKKFELVSGTRIGTTSFYGGWSATVDGPIGGAQYRVVTKAAHDIIRNTSTVSELGDHTLPNGNVLLLEITGRVQVESVGAVGDDTADDTLAIQEAIDLLSNGGTVLFDETGTYKITAKLVIPNRVTLDLNGNGLIKQYTNDTHIIDFTSAAAAHSRQQVINGKLAYNTQQTTSAGSAINLADLTCVTSRWLLSNLAISKAYHSTYVEDGANTFLCVMRDVTSTNSEDYAFYFGGVASVHTNIKLRNVWALQTSGNERPNSKGFKLQNIQELDADNLAVDNAQGIPIQVSTCRGVISNISIESCDRTLSSGTGYHVGIIGSEISIGTILSTLNNITMTGTADFGVLYTDSGAEVECFAISDHDTILTDTSSGVYNTIFTNNSSDRIWNKVSASSGTSPATAINEVSANTPKRIRMFNGENTALELEDMIMATKSSIPSGTNFAEGSVVWHTNPALGEPGYWRLIGTDWVSEGGGNVTTTAALADIANEINTMGKYDGKQVYNADTNFPLWASGSAASSVWRDATASTAHTPV
tara:strand:- start:22 stop:2289 length:2268 start_codon:yes stop_codon:yes gene_type:complete